MKKIASEKGLSGLLVAGIVLPIVVLLLAALLDLTRQPLAQMALKRILLDASYGMEKKAVKDQAGAGFTDESMPPALNIYEFAAGDAVAVKITPETAQTLVKAACELTGSSTSGNFLRSYALSSAGFLAFEFMLVELYPKDPTGFGDPGFSTPLGYRPPLQNALKL